LARRGTAKLAGTMSTQFFAGKTLAFRSPHGNDKVIYEIKTHREFVYRPFQFNKRSQLFIRTHNVTLSVA
jgi:hypothetical protein